MHRTLLGWLPLLLAVACTQAPPPEPEPEPEREPAPPVDDPPPVDTDVAIDCDLTVAPAEPWVTPGQELRLQVSGGSGAPRFALAENRSGALLDEARGAYLAGPTADVVDLIAITDPACPDARLDVSVHVAPPVSLTPSAATLRPGTRLTPEITGGTDAITCRLEGADTGSTLDGCTYLAGPRVGTETLWVEDGRTGDRAAAELRIDPDARLSTPVAHWGGVVDEAVFPGVQGGSGHYRFEVVEGDITATEDGGLVAGSPGRHRLRVVDRFVGLSLDLTYDGLEVLVPDHLQAFGDRTDTGRLLGDHDLDGDGYEDLVALHPEAHAASSYDGVAWVFAGSASGLEPDPAQSLPGPRDSRSAQGGVLADFDGDGELDLAIGRIADSTVAYYQGSLAVYDGVVGGFFEEKPSRILDEVGQARDRLGLAVAACDLDGDGYDDALVSAYLGDDPDAGQAARYQGVVYGFRGGPLGLDDSPSWTLVGRVPERRGGWSARENLRFGLDIVAGDIDGDGRCDVAVSAMQGVDRGASHGSVYVYFGTGAGLPTNADVVLDHDPGFDDTDGRMGRRMALADLDGKDGVDLLVGADGADLDGRGRGTVRAFTSATLVSAQGEVLTLDDADWRADGGLNWDRLGWGLTASDLNGDRVPDLLVGALSDEPSGGTRDTGVAYVWDGGQIRADIRRGIGVAGSPERAFATEERFSRVGTALAGVDSDGDGEREVVVLAGRDGQDAPWGGALYELDGRVERRIGYPRSIHLTYVGLGLAWTRDEAGSPALMVGAPYAVSDVPRYRGGVAWVAPRADLQDTTTRLPDLPVTYDFDQGGWSLDNGDFDGDGTDEQLVVYHMANRPGSFPRGVTTTCPGYGANAGAVAIVEPGAERPAAIFYGAPGDDLDRVHGGSDLDGDGFDDLVIATRGIGRSQGVWVVRGRPLDEDVTTVLCEGTRLISRAANSQLGVSIVGLGDLDRDGCDDVAIGANGDDRGASNQGAVRILRGWGGRGCPAGPSVTDVVPEAGGAIFGTALASADLTGDGVQDLLASATNQGGSGGALGVVYLVDGATLGRLPASAVRDGMLPTGPLHGLRSRVPPLAMVRATPDFPFLGFDLAIGETRDPIVWIPSRTSELGGGHGAVLGYRWRDRSLVLDRILVGPPADHVTHFGSRLAARPGSEDLAIAAYRAHGIGVEAGEVYVWAP